MSVETRISTLVIGCDSFDKEPLSPVHPNAVKWTRELSSSNQPAILMDIRPIPRDAWKDKGLLSEDEFVSTYDNYLTGDVLNLDRVIEPGSVDRIYADFLLNKISVKGFESHYMAEDGSWSDDTLQKMDDVLVSPDCPQEVKDRFERELPEIKSHLPDSMDDAKKKKIAWQLHGRDYLQNYAIKQLFRAIAPGGEIIIIDNASIGPSVGVIPIIKRYIKDILEDEVVFCELEGNIPIDDEDRKRSVSLKKFEEKGIPVEKIMIRKTDFVIPEVNQALYYPTLEGKTQTLRAVFSDNSLIDKIMIPNGSHPANLWSPVLSIDRRTEIVIDHLLPSVYKLAMEYPDAGVRYHATKFLIDLAEYACRSGDRAIEERYKQGLLKVVISAIKEDPDNSIRIQKSPLFGQLLFYPHIVNIYKQIAEKEMRGHEE